MSKRISSLQDWVAACNFLARPPDPGELTSVAVLTPRPDRHERDVLCDALANQLLADATASAGAMAECPFVFAINVDAKSPGPAAPNLSIVLVEDEIEQYLGGAEAAVDFAYEYARLNGSGHVLPLSLVVKDVARMLKRWTSSSRYIQ